jgi:hypothetical protein
MAYPATAPNRNPRPAENRKSSTGNSEVSTPCELWHIIFLEVLNLICNRHSYVRFILYQSTNLHAIPYVRIRQLLPHRNCNFILCLFVKSFSLQFFHVNFFIDCENSYSFKYITLNLLSKGSESFFVPLPVAYVRGVRMGMGMGLRIAEKMDSPHNVLMKYVI